MKKVVLVVGLVAALIVSAVGVAIAQSGDKLTATAEVTEGGSKEKPKNVKAHYLQKVEGPEPGIRADTATRLVTKFAGLKSNYQYFDTCTADEIDAAQSADGCPPKSLIATGRIEAQIGAEADKTQAVLCKKDITIWNGGGGKVSVLGDEDASQCAGIGYLPPVPGTIKKVGKNLVYDLPIPPNIQSPLPGVSGYFSLIEVTFKNTKVEGAKGKMVTFLQSIGCGKAKKRAYSFTAYTAAAPDGQTVKNTAGKC